MIPSQKPVGTTTLSITVTELDAFKPDPLIMRRDPSDIIRANGRYHVWYTRCDKGLHHGYDGTLWHASSPDGVAWTEHGEALARGGLGAWDEQSVFTPNILVAEGRYWLFYTGVPKPFDNGGNQVTRSAIGLAVADSPDGPWNRVGTEPVLRTSDDPEAFDSMRVDDTVMITREGRYWLYYKGRQWDRTPAQTKLGVAVAERPEGPYVKHAGNPVIPAGHEVMAWPLGTGIVALINHAGPEELRQTIQYAGDGVHFQKIGQTRSVPDAAGFYRPEAFTGSGTGTWPEWGIQIADAQGMMPTLNRFDCRWTTAAMNVPGNR